MAFRQRIHESWLLRILAWDCLLPTGIAMAPLVVKTVLPNNRHAVEFLGVSLPVVAFILRIHAGKRHIFSNRCSKITRLFQFCVFCLAILLLVLFDTMTLLSLEMPQGMFSREDMLVPCHN